MSLRQVIVNADDFGRSLAINHGVMEAFQHGILTSASLMVRWPSAVQAARYARRRSCLSVGLHFDFGEWVYRNGSWIQRYRVVDETSVRAVTREIARQLEAFERLMGGPPTHLDSHQHVHLREPVRTCVLGAAHRLGVPVRSLTPGLAHCGEFYGQDTQGRPCPENISIRSLLTILSKLQPGTTEISCHPAVSAGLAMTYSSERVRELKTLVDSRVRAALEGMDIALRSFADWRVCAKSPGGSRSLAE